MFGFNSCYECGKITRSKNGYCSEDCEQKSNEKFLNREKECKNCGNKFQEKDFPETIQWLKKGHWLKHSVCPECEKKERACKNCGKDSGRFVKIDNSPNPFDKDYKTKMKNYKAVYLCEECAVKKAKEIGLTLTKCCKCNKETIERSDGRFDENYENYLCQECTAKMPSKKETW